MFHAGYFNPADDPVPSMGPRECTSGPKDAAMDRTLGKVDDESSVVAAEDGESGWFPLYEQDELVEPFATGP